MSDSIENYFGKSKINADDAPEEISGKSSRKKPSRTPEGKSWKNPNENISGAR